MKQSRDDAWCRGLAGHPVGKYDLDEFIGAGRIGYVYRAHLRGFPNSKVAVKLVFDTLKAGWENELQKVIQLSLVDGVVHFHDLGTETLSKDSISHLAQYTAWDYVPPGENLKAYLSRNKQVPTSFLVAVVERILLVLHACEKEGVPRHGDLHSGNILIGNPSPAKLDDALQPRAPIYVSDFGYGTTGGSILPKNDYEGLARIINEMVAHIDYSTAGAADRQTLEAIKRTFPKVLHETVGTERRTPLELLHALLAIKHSAQFGGKKSSEFAPKAGHGGAPSRQPSDTPNVGYFQVTEMIGERWDWYRRLFVSTVPAHSKILALDIPTVVTGPRGCGKTMLFRRLSERLIVECGDVDDLPVSKRFAAFYVNANDFADAFSHFPARPTPGDEARLVCYANLCVLADVLGVQSAHATPETASSCDALVRQVQQWLVPPSLSALVEGENCLDRYRTLLEQIKWKFPGGAADEPFPGYGDLSRPQWLPRFMSDVRQFCPWVGDRAILLFIDDFSTPRVSTSMQRVLNRLFLQRSPHFLAKVATEAATTFVSEDSSGKNLEDGDDYQLVDMGEEALFLPDSERQAFLERVFARRLEMDQRMPEGGHSLADLLGQTGLTKTEFARRLRATTNEEAEDGQELIAVEGSSQRRGRSRARVLYSGEDVFLNLWSGDTRTMIQLITDVVDQSLEAGTSAPSKQGITLPVSSGLQDRVFRNRGGEWLTAHTRNEPTQPQRVKEALAEVQRTSPGYKLCGEYGDHLKAVVEAFVAAARRLLLGAPYRIREGNRDREVPRMAFRVEIVDDFRIDGLAREIYRDLVRYGLFIRDSRGKSVRGTFVPRLFLRRLLLPYATLALSKRDSVPLKCVEFTKLLLTPDVFKAELATRAAPELPLPLFDGYPKEIPESAYEDLSDQERGDVPPDPISPPPDEDRIATEGDHA